jgi:hypothetical protein
MARVLAVAPKYGIHFGPWEPSAGIAGAAVER